MTKETGMEKSKSPIHWLVSEPLVMFVIGLNAIVLVLDGFPFLHNAAGLWLGFIDYICLLFFILEASIKILRDGFPSYWKEGWNKFDFVIVLASTPLLLQPFLGSSVDFFSILLVGRFLRFLRVMKFIPNGPKMWAGVLRALKASMAVFLTLFVLNLILALGANILFGKIAPEFFGDPIRAAYSLFKVFTVEGWYEIPDTLALRDIDPTTIFFLRIYFMISVLTGGILGLSLANAVFVDEMTADNNDRLEQMVEELKTELEATRLDREEQQKILKDSLNDIQLQLDKLLAEKDQNDR